MKMTVWKWVLLYFVGVLIYLGIHYLLNYRPIESWVIRTAFEIPAISLLVIFLSRWYDKRRKKKEEEVQ